MQDTDSMSLFVADTNLLPHEHTQKSSKHNTLPGLIEQSIYRYFSMPDFHLNDSYKLGRTKDQTSPDL